MSEALACNCIGVTLQMQGVHKVEAAHQTRTLTLILTLTRKLTLTLTLYLPYISPVSPLYLAIFP